MSRRRRFGLQPVEHGQDAIWPSRERPRWRQEVVQRLCEEVLPGATTTSGGLTQNNPTFSDLNVSANESSMTVFTRVVGVMSLTRNCPEDSRFLTLATSAKALSKRTSRLLSTVPATVFRFRTPSARLSRYETVQQPNIPAPLVSRATAMQGRGATPQSSKVAR